MTYDNRTQAEKDEALLIEAYWVLRTCERFVTPLSNYGLINRIAKRINRPMVGPFLQPGEVGPTPPAEHDGKRRPDSE